MHQNTLDTPVARPAQARIDLYGAIHKALRALMADTLLAVGRMDTDDALALADGTQRVQQLLEFCQNHLQHENAHVHPALEARASGSAAAIAQEHHAHEDAIASLADQATALLRCPPAQRAARAHALYQQLALFVAHNFQHMHVEETAHNAVLWAHYDDAALLAIHDALVAAIPPAEMLFTLRWMVPALPPAERVALLADMQAHAPAPAFAAALDTVRPHLPAGDWAALSARLGLSAT
ncbi:hemerythrin domain-containing protein [Pseudorhodoferax sp.]|uniref:hemerythrin domain-containing protein n=1 Tax=Pseudorhodoferax sp. TaxID=1993553 RepID=UPI002DD64AF6|nr:hemerythrin domain-containing protein [Pseudorhodoferax sp.]